MASSSINRQIKNWNAAFGTRVRVAMLCRPQLFFNRR
jgi:hypothetical protein